LTFNYKITLPKHDNNTVRHSDAGAQTHRHTDRQLIMLAEHPQCRVQTDEHVVAGDIRTAEVVGRS